MRPFNAMTIFSATLPTDRSQLGERVTAWLSAHGSYRISDIVVTQSSDASFHCLSISVFYSQ